MFDASAAIYSEIRQDTPMILGKECHFDVRIHEWSWGSELDPFDSPVILIPYFDRPEIEAAFTPSYGYKRAELQRMRAALGRRVRLEPLGSRNRAVPAGEVVPLIAKRRQLHDVFAL